MRHYTATLAAVELHSAEVFSIDAGNAVVACEGSVDEGELAVDEVEHASVFAHDGPAEERGLLPHCIEQLVIHRGEARGVWFPAIEQSQAEPLSGEIFYQRIRFRVVQHSSHFGFEHAGFVELSFVCRTHQLLDPACCSIESRRVLMRDRGRRGRKPLFRPARVRCARGNWATLVLRSGRREYPRRTNLRSFAPTPRDW